MVQYNMHKIVNLPSTTISGKSYLAAYDCFSVYAWLRKTEWLYVGLSTSIYQRLFTHDTVNIKEKVKNTDRIVIWKCESKEQMVAFEKQLIKRHHPMYNVHMNTIDEDVEYTKRRNIVEEYFHLKKLLPAFEAKSSYNLDKKPSEKRSGVKPVVVYGPDYEIEGIQYLTSLQRRQLEMRNRQKEKRFQSRIRTMEAPVIAVI